MDRRARLTGDRGARTVWVLFYVGAVERADRWLQPVHVYRMTDTQAGATDATSREAYRRTWKAAGSDRWYHDNSREGIRDDTLRYGFAQVGATILRPGVAVTANRPRWALAADFADLFLVDDAAFTAAAEAWRQRHLSPAALARLRLAARGIAGRGAGHHVPVLLPNGAVRQLPPGESTAIVKGIVEEFLPRFLASPGVIWISDSRRQVVIEDRELTDELGLRIADTAILPDLVAIDIPDRGPSPVFVFVEVVASEGPIDPARKAALLKLLADGGFGPEHARFVTAYWDRNHPAFRRTIGEVAWNTAVWVATEPASIITTHADGGGARLTDLVSPG